MYHFDYNALSPLIQPCFTMQIEELDEERSLHNYDGALGTLGMAQSCYVTLLVTERFTKASKGETVVMVLDL